MTTLAIMKARIASELRRSDLTDQITSAITTAIEAYQHERLDFQETRSVTFSTVADQEFYDSDDAANLGTIEFIDYVKLYVDNYPYRLKADDPGTLEQLSQNGTHTGTPLNYAYYGGQIRLWPVPAAVYTVRIGGVAKVAAPATDNEADNPWMTTAEELIRCRAKYELFEHVLMDMEKAPRFNPDNEAGPTYRALKRLKARTNNLGQQGGWLVQPTCF